jgi:quinol monooxygenase YgiN
MSYVLAKLNVEDYPRWKTAFDERKATRKEIGSKEAHLFRNLDDKNDVVILFDWKDLASARKYMESDDIREYLKNAGAEIVSITYLDKQEISV